MSFRYEYFGPKGERRSRTLTDGDAARIVGDRVLIGFDLYTYWLADRDGECFRLTVFQSAITGNVWSVFWAEPDPVD